jgi:polyisoprenoid-binding protein YceI
MIVLSKLKLYQLVFGFMLLLVACAAESAASNWKIDPSKSNLTFTGTQNNAPTSGSFKKFDGIIQFSLDQLNISNVAINIDTSSINTSYILVSDMLKSADWFDVKTFPKAVYTAKLFSKVDQHNYIAHGSLTIRDKTMPVMVKFNWQDSSPITAQVRGSANVKRSSFGVGRGEWAGTDLVKDDVTINFSLSLNKA